MWRAAADGFAGGAEVVFLDEIFRARALLPALLQLLNERTWPDGSRNRPAKLVSAVAATNALRDADDDDDDALFDRFLFRRAVAPVSDAGALDLLLTPTDADESDETALLAPLADPGALHGARATLPRRRAAVLASCRAWLRDERGEYVSDRRLRRCSEAIRAAALACGRTEVGAVDLLLAADALWQRPETRAPLVDWLVDHAVPDDAATMRLLLDALRARDPSERRRPGDRRRRHGRANRPRRRRRGDGRGRVRLPCAGGAGRRETGAGVPLRRATVRARRRPRERDGRPGRDPRGRAAAGRGGQRPGVSERVWDDDEEDDDESDGKRRKKKRKKKR